MCSGEQILILICIIVLAGLLLYYIQMPIKVFVSEQS